MKVVSRLRRNKKVLNRCPDCGRPVFLVEMYYTCSGCGCSGYFLLDVERWSCGV